MIRNDYYTKELKKGKRRDGDIKVKESIYILNNRNNSFPLNIVSSSLSNYKKYGQSRYGIAS